MPTRESAAHLELKRLALIWAQANGYPIAEREVSLPNLRFRLDVAAYRPASKRVVKLDERRGTYRAFAAAALGLSAIFDCKASRADLVRDCKFHPAARPPLGQKWQSFRRALRMGLELPRIQPGGGAQHRFQEKMPADRPTGLRPYPRLRILAKDRQAEKDSSSWDLHPASLPGSSEHFLS